MRQNRNELLRAVRYALYVGTAAAVGLTAAPAFAQEEGGDKGETLETIVVTGSRIRRVDLETSSPVFVIDKSAIEKTGKLTIGDLLQEAPSIAGAATNPSVNNGGGSGAATVSLRGLGSARTLLLVNGQRVFYNDVNSIPINMVERIEILKDGASAVYGSDAIGGVVNFITRRDFQGMEASFDYGVSDRDDGERKGGSLTIGHSSDRGSLVVGVTYNRQDAVGAGDREFSNPARYNNAGDIYALGSGTIPNGRFVVSRAALTAAGLNCGGTAATGQITRIAGRPGTSMSDFRCYVGQGPGNDTYDYSPFNLELTPSERAGLFASGNYRISDNVEAYFEAFTNKTRSNYQLAPLPLILGAAQSGVVIDANSVYNPFDVTINSGGIRMSVAGNRIGNFSTQADQLNTGLRGTFGDTWNWDAGISWARTNQNSSLTGYYRKRDVADASGPSFIDANGVARCGTQGAIIANCTPINFLGLDNSTPEGRANLAALQALAVTPSNQDYSNEKIARFNLTGEIVELPAGALSIAFGGEYRKDYQFSQPDVSSLITDELGNCLTARDACAAASKGELSVREFYAEFFVPVLKDVFLAKSLNFTLGSRYSDYSAFGDTTNSKIGVEWRPIDDVLLRGTVAEVFRSPTISDLYSGVAPNAATYTDPCRGLVANDPRLSNPACAGLSPGFNQTTPQTSALSGSNDQLKPEEGKSFTWGVVYDPSWLEGFSTSVDVWRIYLTSTIGALGTQTILNQCFNNGRFCNLFTRDTLTGGAGDVEFVNDRLVNIGRIDTAGVDMSFKYRLPETSWGNFRAALDLTYLQKYNVQTLEGEISSQFNAAGSFFGSAFGGDGNYARWRGIGTVAWNMGNFDASWRMRYIGPTRFGGQSQAGDGYGVITPAGGPQSFRTGAYTYHNVQFGYNIEPIHTTVEVGIDNLFDKQAPQLWQYGFNGNTDERTYDTVGRYYWMRAGVKF